MLAVWCPVLLNRDIEAEGCDLENVTSVNIGCEQGYPERLSVRRQVTQSFSIRRGIRIEAARANTLAIVAIAVHAPEGLVERNGIKPIKDNPRSVGCEGWIEVADSMVGGQFNEVAPVSVHDRDARATGRRVGFVNFENDLAPIGRPVGSHRTVTHKRDLAQILTVRTNCKDLCTVIGLSVERDTAVPAWERRVGGSRRRSDYGTDQQDQAKSDFGFHCHLLHCPNKSAVQQEAERKSRLRTYASSGWLLNSKNATFFTFFLIGHHPRRD